MNKNIEKLDVKTFKDWKFRLEMAAKAVDPGYFQLLNTWAAKDAPIDMTHDTAPNQGASSEIYYLLAQKTSGEAFDLIKGVPEQNGAEAWRLLVARFDAKTIGKEMLLARKCVNPPKVKAPKDLPGAIDKWEDDVRRLEVEYEEKLGDGLKRAILIEMLPTTLTEGVMVRLKPGEKYPDVKDMVLAYVATKVDFGGPAPMDCSNVNQGNWGDEDPQQEEQHEADELNWMGKGKSKGKGFQGRCHACGQFGHRAGECPSKGGNSKGKGKDWGNNWNAKDSWGAKGKGKTCWTCGEQGHRAFECPKGKGKGKFGMNTGKGNYWHGKGQTYGMDNMDDQWHGGQEAATFSLCSLEAVPKAGEPMKVNLLDFIKPKKIAKKTAAGSPKQPKPKVQNNSFALLALGGSV